MTRKDLRADLQRFADKAIVDMDDLRLSKRKASKHKSNWSSNLYHPCIRFHYYNRLHGDERRFEDAELLYRFEEGNDTERILIRMFNEVGIDVILSQQYFTWSKYHIGGRIDGMVHVPISHIVNGDEIIKPEKFPLEIKSLSPFFWESTRSIEEIPMRWGGSSSAGSTRRRADWNPQFQRPPRDVSDRGFPETEDRGRLGVAAFAPLAAREP